jgi:predicted GIY-YIG superfamily endonuclease
MRQHNGEITGGAKYTRGGRPWRLVAHITGFKTKTHALQMEWAIKHCTKASTKIKFDLATSKSRNKNINQRVAKLFTVLMKDRVTARAPLNSEQEYVVKFYDNRFAELENLIANCQCVR